MHSFNLSTADDLLHIGVAFSAITPPVGFAISGPEFADRPSRGVDDDIHVRCVALTSYGEVALIASLDVWGISADLRDRLVNAISEATGIPVDSVLVTCTNNGTSPPLWLDESDRPAHYANYTRYLPEVVAGAALDATLSLEPAAVGSASISVPGLSCFANSPQAESLETERETLRLIAFHTAADQMKCVLYNFACPATVVGCTHQWNADYPGIASSVLEQAGVEAVIFMQGASDDVRPYDWWNGNPDPSHSARLWQDAQAFGILIATQAMRATQNIVARRNAPIRASRFNDVGINALRIGDSLIVSTESPLPLVFSAHLRTALDDGKLIVNTNQITHQTSESDKDNAELLAKCIDLARRM